MSEGEGNDDLSAPVDGTQRQERKRLTECGQQKVIGCVGVENPEAHKVNWFSGIKFGWMLECKPVLLPIIVIEIDQLLIELRVGEYLGRAMDYLMPVHQWRQYL